MSEPAQLYLLHGVKNVPPGQGLGSVAGPLIGRDRELTQLRQSLETTEETGVNVVSIIGPPGVGKSRLCNEFAEICRTEGIPVDVIRAQPHGTATPLQPMMEFLRSTWLRLDPDELSLMAAGRIEEALAELGFSDPPDRALVCDFLGIRAGHAPRAWPNQKARVARLIDIFRAVVRRRGMRRAVIIIEDLHWLDAASEDFVAAMAEAVLATRCLIVVNERPGGTRAWMKGPHAQQIALAELSQKDTEALVGMLVGPAPLLDDLCRQIIVRSGGNPFFAEELIYALQGQGVLVGESGAFRRSITQAAAVLPQTIRAVISARIDSLPAQPKRLLQMAAVIGQTFRMRILVAVVPATQSDLTLSLNRLCDDGLLIKLNDATAASYRFRHPLIQEVAYATQLRSTRVPLHAAIARAMAELDDAAAEAAASVISYHYEEAGETRQAATFAAQAARWFGPRSSAEATRYWRKVRVLIGQEPRSPETDPLRIEASGQIAWVGWREGLSSDVAEPFVQEALEWARETDDPITPLLMQVQGRIIQVNGGRADAFVELLLQAIQLAQDRDDVGRVATLQAALSHGYGWAGLLNQALEANDAALAGVAAISDFDHGFLGYSVEHWAIALRGRILVRLGRFDEATECLDAIININELIDPTVQFIGHLGYVDLAWCIDNSEMAKLHATKIGALAVRHGSSYLQTYYRYVSALAQGIAGDYVAAIQSLDETLDHVTQTSTAIELKPEILASLADYCVRSGNPAAAVQPAYDAIALADLRNARLPGCRARIAGARALLAVGTAHAHDQSVILLGKADELIRETGAKIYNRHWIDARHELDRNLTMAVRLG